MNIHQGHIHLQVPAKLREVGLFKFDKERKSEWKQFSFPKELLWPDSKYFTYIILLNHNNNSAQKV